MQSKKNGMRGDKEGAALSRETVGHLQSAYCEGQAKAVTNAHHNCFEKFDNGGFGAENGFGSSE